MLAVANQKKTGPLIVEALIAAGADPNKAARNGTPIRKAISAGNVKIYKLLISKGAVLNPIDITYVGLEPGSLEILKDLLARGLDINTVNREADVGRVYQSHLLHAVLSYAVMWGTSKSKQPLTMPMLEYLTANGINWQAARPADGAMPLQILLEALSGRYTWMSADQADLAYLDGIVTYCLSKGDINARNNKGATALYTAVSRSDVELTKRLLKWGADPNLEVGGSLPLQQAMAMKWYNNLTKRAMIDALCSAPGFDVNKEQTNNMFPLIAASSSNDLETMARLLATPGIDVNKMKNAGSALHQAKSAEAVNLLVAAGADVNLLTGDNKATPLHFAAFFGHRSAIEGLVKAPGFNPEIKIRGFTVLERAEKNTYTKVPEINAFLVKLLTPPETLWEGWTRNDLDKFDVIFEDATANEYSCCPVCLKYVERSEGCMYIREHKCTAHGKDYYHKELYGKYKSPEGKIYWCTICGRISMGHRHYELAAANGPVPTLLVGHDPFAPDCKREGGGGRIEKVARFRRRREYALELQDDVGKKTFTTAMNELVEEMWNAPLARKGVLKRIMEEKKWNIPADAFPAPPPPPAEVAIDFASFPNLNRPADEAVLVPTVVQGTDVILQEPDMEVIQFHHKQPDGSINHHTVTCIGADSLTHMISQAVGAYKTPTFGLCWEANGCKGRLWPEEIKPFVPDELYNDYRMKFNWKFRAGGGAAGGRRTRKQRKTRDRTHRGGHQQNIFVPATDAQCYLPTNRRTNKRNNMKSRNSRNSRNNRNNRQ
jgi:ankyrin repeat protein